MVPLNKTQWLLIWLTTVACLILWLASDPEPKSFIMPGLLVGGLFVWQASQRDQEHEN